MKKFISSVLASLVLLGLNPINVLSKEKSNDAQWLPVASFDNYDLFIDKTTLNYFNADTSWIYFNILKSYKFVGGSGLENVFQIDYTIVGSCKLNKIVYARVVFYDVSGIETKRKEKVIDVLKAEDVEPNSFQAHSLMKACQVMNIPYNFSVSKPSQMPNNGTI